MHPFFRSRRALSSAPEATPYQRAGQAWDDRMGLSLAHARNWRRMAVANLGLAVFLGAGWWVQSDRAVVKPFVVEVSDWGET
ncbi:VirB8/TrbF family protein, partial [Brevundimonas sp.]